MLKVYKLYVDKVDWDEYISCIVVAKSPDDAFQTLKKHSEVCYFNESQGKVHIEEIDLNKKDVILAKFLNG